MICIISPTHYRAKSWADNQDLEPSEWFHVLKPEELLSRTNFHTIVIEAFPFYQLSLFEHIYKLARQRGKIGRK